MGVCAPAALVAFALAASGCDATGQSNADAATDLSTSPADLASPGDGSGQPLDLAPVPGADLLARPDLGLNYAAARIHDIDTDPGNGPLSTGALVLLDHVVAVSKVDKYVNSQNQQCRYELWVQDPDCKRPPCGLVIKAIGPMAPSPTSTGKDCPAARLSGTPLANVGNGDNIRVRGKVQVEVDSTPPMTEVEHQVFIDTLEPLPNTAAITPLVLSDTTQYSKFIAHSGAGWATYEGMSVTLAPTGATLQVFTTSKGGFQTIPGPVDWANTFDGDYIPTGVTDFPTIGSTFKSISGVVSARHGGGIMPVRNKDFVP